MTLNGKPAPAALLPGPRLARIKSRDLLWLLPDKWIAWSSIGNEPVPCLTLDGMRGLARALRTEGARALLAVVEARCAGIDGSRAAVAIVNQGDSPEEGDAP